MHVIIAGGGGFIGSAVGRALRDRGDSVTVISRSAGPGRITWDDVAKSGLPTCDAVIHLAGAHILQPGKRWSRAYREEVLGSRVRTTRALVEAMAAMTSPPQLFVSTVGKCLYGPAADGAAMDERHCRDTGDFPNVLSRAWMAEAAKVRKDIRHVQIRLGIVMADDGDDRLPRVFARGVLPAFRRLFATGLAFGFGDGRQGLPWVHIDDVVALYLAALDRPAWSGAYNAVAPTPTTNAMFARALAARLGVRFRGFLPRGLIHAAVGAERVGILTQGQFVHPTRTLASGFRFRFATIEAALDDLVELRRGMSTANAGVRLGHPTSGLQAPFPSEGREEVDKKKPRVVTGA
jgi:uncharacterized protein (TIGR01777 family)